MDILQIIAKKRDGFELTTDEINYFISGCTNGTIADYQTSALLMAIVIRGMSKRETLDLTLATVRSGDCMDLSPIEGLKADKHSTGGVGDKTSLIAMPIAAACGVTVAKISGRGLGHTGGTVDKLQSVPGLHCDMTFEKFVEICNTVGVCIASQTAHLVPADKKLYALRDVTSTVQSVPLIAASVMSKKIASGADVLVLDVKYGSGAFMKTVSHACELAREMLDIAKGAGIRARAVISDMNIPLGAQIGNACEVREAMDILRGHGDKRLYGLCISLAENMIDLCFDCGIDEAGRRCAEAVESGLAYEKLCEMLTAQGGDLDAFEKVRPLYKSAVRAEKDGCISKLDSELIGRASCLLGAGRMKKDDIINPAAGITVLKTLGDKVKSGDMIAELYSDNEKLFSDAEKLYLSAVTYSDEQPKLPDSTVYTVMT